MRLKDKAKLHKDTSLCQQWDVGGHLVKLKFDNHYVWYHQPFLNQKYGQTPCFWWLVVLTDTNLRSLYIKVEQTGQDLAFSPSDLLTWCLVLGRGTNVNFVTHCWNSAIACPNLAWWFADTVFSIRSRDIAADFMLSGFVETTKLRKTKCQGDQ